MGVELMNDAFVNVFTDRPKRGGQINIIAVTLYIKDSDFKQYQTDLLVASGTPTLGEFTMSVMDSSSVPVYNKKTGPIGTICVGDMDFTLIP